MAATVAMANAWDRPDIVAGFARSTPNPHLVDYAHRRRRLRSGTRVLDIGCGAGRNAVPLARDGFDVIGVDRSRPMLEAAARSGRGRLLVVEAVMDRLPIRSGTIDMIVAHGIWNLARSDTEFRSAIAEAARIAARGAALFVFTFSRATLSESSEPIRGEELAFDQFSGSPQIFLTEQQLVAEMATAGFEPDPQLPLRELNRGAPGCCLATTAPVILQAGFIFSGL